MNAPANLTDRSRGAASAAERWAELVRQPVLLPTGAWALIRLRSAAAMLTAGIFPEDLTAVAMRFATVGIDPKEITVDELTQLERMQRTMVASMVEALCFAPEDPDRPGHPLRPSWERQQIDPRNIADAIPGPDYSALLALANRQRTIAQQTNHSRMELNWPAPEPGTGAPKEDEVVATLDDAARFPDGRRGS